MDKLTSGRRWAALFALSLGGFGLGLAEFATMGLLPEMARTLLPDAYAADSAATIAKTGWVITVYALGVVVGAPTIAVLTARVPRRRLVLILLGTFVAGTMAAVFAPTFELVLVSRFVSALAHGAYFGAAAFLAGRTLGPGNQGKGFAIVLGGLTASNLLGVPLVIALGQAQTWRIAYMTIAAVFALSMIAVSVTIPSSATVPTGSPRTELRAFRSPRVWLAALVVSVGSAGFFAVNSYIAPLITQVTDLPAGAVPLVIAVLGLGMTVGVFAGGAAADRDLRKAILWGFVAVIVSIVLFGLAAGYPYALSPATLLVGATCAFINPALQSHLIETAPDAQLMGGAVNQSATNVANSLGAALGGAAIAAGLGYLAPIWIGAALAATGLLLALLSLWVTPPRRPVPDEGPGQGPGPDSGPHLPPAPTPALPPPPHHRSLTA
ncbi:MFS transporter [Actinoplanes couchii]|uniref:MFS transporter n=1 Tax=Actinoplanes couchii TaxID=403638 RepID=A0ABQ3X1L0_9ACTN|nr:MFS transporter [Actinoplanes couchii]MDR6316744.1 DHA1 family inner membrane transport protein [Actinoplanes couchii]GID52352.1 MFS transporter [Actinoplanes couchii]